MKNKKLPSHDISKEELARLVVEMMESRGINGRYSCSNSAIQKEIDRLEVMQEAKRQDKVLEGSVMQVGEEQQKKSI